MDSGTERVLEDDDAAAQDNDVHMIDFIAGCCPVALAALGFLIVSIRVVLGLLGVC